MDPAEYEAGKMFVGGLSWETDEDSMKRYFETFGVLAECVVMRDPNQPPGMKKNKGFGFVKFEDPSAVDKVLQRPTHMLDNKTIDPKRALKKSCGKDSAKKVFLGGLSSTTTEKQVEEYFKHHFGGVTEVTFKTDRMTDRKRGFGFVIFESADYVDQVLQSQYHTIDGKQVEAKRAQPRSATESAMRHTNPTLGYAPVPPQYSPGDYRGASNGQYPGQQWGSGAQPYYPYPPPPQAGYGPGQQGYSPGQQGYGPGQQGYGPGQQYSYDQQQAYPRTQSSTGNTQDNQSYYQQPYGHAGGQQLPYGPDTSSYNVRSAYPPQESYGQQPTGYGGGQQQPRYGGGAGGYGQH